MFTDFIAASVDRAERVKTELSPQSFRAQLGQGDEFCPNVLCARVYDRTLTTHLFSYSKWSNSPYINHFIQPDTIIPDQFNPQTWNRYSYTANNPIRYNDPDGHCAPACAVPVIVGIVAIVGITAAFYVTVSPAAHEYLSKRVLDSVNDFERNVNDTNAGKNFPIGGCTSSVKMAAICIGGALAIGKALVDSFKKGGCGEAESNVSCPATSTATSTPTVTSTLAPSSTPTLSPTPSPSSTPTRSPTRTPKRIPTRMPTIVATPSISSWERRFQLRGVEW